MSEPTAADQAAEAITQATANNPWVAKAALAAVPADGDPRTVGERLNDGAVAERVVRYMGYRLQLATGHGMGWEALRSVDPEAAALLDRLAGGDQ